MFKFLENNTKKSYSLSFEQIIDFNHMNNTDSNASEAWNKIWNSFKHPMVLLPIIGAVIALIIAYGVLSDKDDTFLKSVLQLFSALLIGIATNYFTSFFSLQEEKRILKNKAEHTVRQTNNLLNRVLHSKEINETEKYLLTQEVAAVIDFWKDYYPQADFTLVAKMKALKDTIDNKQLESMIIKNAETQLLQLTTDASTSGLSSYVSLSGATGDNTPLFNIPPTKQ